jgi:hypothetical protein
MTAMLISVRSQDRGEGRREKPSSPPLRDLAVCFDTTPDRISTYGTNIAGRLTRTPNDGREPSFFIDAVFSEETVRPVHLRGGSL